MKRPPALGFHGVTIGCPDPARASEEWRRLLRLPVLRKAPGEVILGAGPELFVRFRRRSGAPSVEDLHLAVQEIAAFRRPVSEDALGGRSFARDLPGAALVLRQIERAPGRRWKKRRR